MPPDPPRVIPDWQIAAAREPIVWTGDLRDDCTADWAGLLLRAERMERTWWWWAVYEGAHDVADSGSGRFTNGKKARRAAEQAAREWLGLAPPAGSAPSNDSP